MSDTDTSLRGALLRRPGVTSLLTGVLWLTGCAPALDWREMRPPEADGLVARFPCKPDTASRMVPVPGLGGPQRLQMLVCQHEGTSWSLAYLRVADVRQVGVAMEGLQQALRENVQAAAVLVSPDRRATESAPTPVEVPRMTPQPAARGLAFVTERPDGLGRPMSMRVNAWHFAHGLTVFQATVWQPAERPALESGDDVATTFLRGFQFPE